jgi:hypothetical protein
VATLQDTALRSKRQRHVQNLFFWVLIMEMGAVAFKAYIISRCGEEANIRRRQRGHFCLKVFCLWQADFAASVRFWCGKRK